MMLVPNKEAIDAMVLALNSLDYALVDNRGAPGAVTHKGHIRSVLGDLLVAGAEHLTDAGLPVGSKQMGEALARARTEGFEAGRAEPFSQRQAIMDDQWMATMKAQQTAAEFAGEHSAAMADTLERMPAWMDEQTIALARMDDARVGAYEVWRDALLIASNRAVCDVDDQVLDFDFVEDYARRVETSLKTRLAPGDVKIVNHPEPGDPSGETFAAQHPTPPPGTVGAP